MATASRKSHAQPRKKSREKVACWGLLGRLRTRGECVLTTAGVGASPE